MDFKLNKTWWLSLSNRNISQDMDALTQARVRLMNQFAFAIFIFMLGDACWKLFQGLHLEFFALLILSGAFFALSIYTKMYSKSKIGLYIYICETLLLFYFSSSSPIYQTITPYYFALLFAALFIFPERASFYNVFIFIWVIALFYGVQFLRMGWIEPQELKGLKFEIGDIWGGSFSLKTLLLWMLNGYFLLLKQEEFKKLYQRSVTKKSMVPQLVEVSTAIPSTPALAVTDVVEMAKTDDLAFIPAFKQLFPDFHARLLKINPDLTAQEFKFCALLKLGFSTKDISNYNHLAVRSVQTKKSRLRKSLNIPREEDLYQWIDKL